MPKEIRAVWNWLKTPEMSAGKITLVTVLSGALVSVMTFGAYFQLGIPNASAATSTVQTSVTVLNVAPVWTDDAEETTESSTSTPTQSGYTIQWTAIGTDSNGDNYYLLICKTGGAPTANTGAAPTCNGGGTNQWAVTGSIVSGVRAYAATTTLETFPFNNESNAWYAWICDSVAASPACNLASTQGSGSTVSPFVINHPPAFSVIVNDSPGAPGETVTWTATATDTDVIRGGDLVGLWVCKTTGFATSTCDGGLSDTWASSTLASFNPATTTTITIPTQDQTYAAYVYVQDHAGRQATSTLQGTNVSFVVTNATSTIQAASISVNDTDAVGNITLTNPNATSGPFTVTFTVTDNNSCLNASSGNEISSATTSIYRSGYDNGPASPGQSSCQAAGDFNTNACYPSANSQTVISCSQTGVCGGATDTTIEWTCTFYLWANADPTDVANTQYFAENWLASVQVVDDNYATSTTVEASSGNEVGSFLAFDVSTTSIAYPGLQPGSNTPFLSQITELLSWGNTGLDELLYGDTMCIGWTIFDSCDSSGLASSSEIAIWNQQAATSSVAFDDAWAYPMHSSTTPLSIALQVPKTTSTSSVQSKNTYWGIEIPIEITTSGAYLGQNVIGGIVSNASFW